jgi:hypothetical protein
MDAPPACRYSPGMDTPRIIRSRTFEATLTALLMAPRGSGPRAFRTSPVLSLPLGFDGIDGDQHGGPTRRSGGREPWYPRGTEMRNERQISLVAEDDLAAAATEMGIERIDPAWIGANMVVAGVRHLTLLPPRSLLFFANGATIRIDGLNKPCRFSGRSIADEYPDRDNLDLAFVKAARLRRGLVGFVEKPGTVSVGETIRVQTPDHWLYEF